MRAFAFIFFAVGAPDAWALLDARRVRRSNRLLSTANFGQRKVTASDADWSDRFGSSVAIDGDTVVIGATTAGTGGAVYVLHTTDGGATYVEVAKLTASDAADGDRFGWSVAIDGTTVVVGTQYGNAAYVFRTTDDGATYAQVAKLTSDAATDDAFGASVAIDGATIVVGARYDDDGGLNSGSVYIFRTSDGGATYGQVAKLTASDAAVADYFGRSVAIDGSIVVVGATYHDPGGAVYVFRTTDGGATYDEVAKLMASDGADWDVFGSSVAINGNTIAVGSWGDDSWTGSVYVFRTTDDGATYGQVAKLTADDAAASDYFGVSVAISGDTIVIGAYKDDDDGSSSGSAYVFRTTDGGATYGEVAKLTASDAAAGDEFGRSVAIDGDTIVVGADQDSHEGTETLEGSAYVFSPPAPTVQPTHRPTFQPTTPQPTMSPKPIPQPTTPQPSTAALGSDSATRACGTLATALLAFAATALAL